MLPSTGLFGEVILININSRALADFNRVVILVTFFIYIRAGREIYLKHQQLRKFGVSSSFHDPEPLPPMDDPFNASKTTEVSVTSEVITSQGIDLAPLGRRGSDAAPKPPNAAYSVTISSDRRPNNRESYGDVVLPIQSNVTIAPSTAAPRAQTANPIRKRAAYEANNAAWSYTKCAILFFTAMLVTWIPSSANRVYSVVHTDQVSVPLEYMSAFVLPLQGFWNAIIYIVTSWKACKMLVDDVKHARRPNVQEIVGFRPNDGFNVMSSPRNNRSDKTYESESMTELAIDENSRPASHEQSGASNKARQ